MLDRLAHSRWAWMPLGFALLLSIPPAAFTGRQRFGEDFLTVDMSWRMELPWRWAHGQWAGRDLIFTYGPMYQAIHAIGLIADRDNPAALLRWLDIGESLICALVFWLLLRATGAPWAWRAALLAWWCLVYLVPASLGATMLKPFGALGMLAGLAVLVVQAHSSVPWRGTLERALAFAAGPLALLYSFDLGVVTFATMVGLLLVLFCVAWRAPGETAARLRRRVGETAIAVGLGGVALIGVSRVLPGWQRYLSDSWQIASSYSVMMALECLPVDFQLLGAGLLADLAIAAWCAWQIRRAILRGNKPQLNLAMLMALALFCALWIRYGLTRSDAEHISRALLPTMFITAILFPAVLRSGGGAQSIAARWMSLALPLSLLALLPAGDDWQRGLALRWQNVGASTFARSTLASDNAELDRAVALAKRASEKELYVFPYQSVVNLLAAKPSAAYTLQAYSASNEHLEARTVAQLEQSESLAALWLPGGGRLDGLPHLTRNGHVFRYLVERFEAARAPDGPRLLLRRAAVETRIWTKQELFPDMQQQPRRIELGPPPEEGRDGPQLVLDLPRGELRASDLFILTLRLSKTSSYGFLKGGWIGLVIDVLGEKSVLVPLKLPADGQSHELLLCACDDTSPWCMSHFSPRRQLRTPETIARLRLTWVPMDLLSRRPTWLQAEGLRVLRRKTAQSRDVAIAAGTPMREAFTWCFADLPSGEDQP